MQKILIVAVSENGVIGKDGELPWYYPEDMKHFKEKTTGNTVLMGRKTYESLPDDYRPLPDRKNIVLSRSAEDDEFPDEVEVAQSFEEAWDIAEDRVGQKVFVIGGASVYEQALSSGKVHRIVLTRIHDEYEGDSYFPISKKELEEEWEEVERDEGEELSFIEYEKA